MTARAVCEKQKTEIVKFQLKSIVTPICENKAQGRQTIKRVYSFVLFHFILISAHLQNDFALHFLMDHESGTRSKVKA